jgi:hypothetical protein
MPEDNQNPEKPLNQVVLPGNDMPSVFANEAFVVANTQRVRLVFGDYMTGPAPLVHSSISMPVDKALALADAIVGMVNESRTRAEQFKQKNMN